MTSGREEITIPLTKINPQTFNSYFNTQVNTILEMMMGDGVAVIPTGVKGHILVPFACNLVACWILADQAGDIVIDIWKDTFANYPPTVADTITAAAKPTLSSASAMYDPDLTGWTVACSQADVLAFNIDSIATITRATIGLQIQKV